MCMAIQRSSGGLSWETKLFNHLHLILFSIIISAKYLVYDQTYVKRTLHFTFMEKC